MKKRLVLTAVIAGALSLSMAVSAFAAINSDGAKQAALNHAGVSEDNTGYVRVKPEYEHGSMVFEVEFTTNDFKEYDYEINADDGSIIKYDYDAEIYNLNNGLTSFNQRGKTDFAVSAEAAQNTALSMAGLKAEDVQYINSYLDYDDGIYAYEGKFFHGNYEYEFEVDATSGAIIKFEMEKQLWR